MSPDGVTVLIGQNESGKSSIIEGLNAFYTKEILRHDIRTGDPLPSVECTFEFGHMDAEAFRTTVDPGLHTFFAWVAAGLKVSIRADWDDGQIPGFRLSLSDSDIRDELSGMRTPVVPPPGAIGSDVTESSEPQSARSEASSIPTDDEFARFVYDQVPPFVLFADGEQMLPDQIDIPLPPESKNGDATAARNFLKIAKIDADSIVKLHDREADTLLRRASGDITRNFQEFWAQQIGKNAKIRLECELKHKDATETPPGAPYLVFYISEGQDKLHPQQRSKGVRWFLSFYLLVTATKQTSDRRIFLLDEPGANLHSKAQKDVLKLLENMRTSSQVIYSTHSSDLVELKHLYRILAVQRASDDDDRAATTVKRGHELYTASPDTLAPLQSAMGIDIASQGVVKRTNNILLEEASGFYYLQAFRRLCGKTDECNLIPGGGANNITTLAYLLFGWGIDFGALVDDEPTGRSVLKELRNELSPLDVATGEARFRKLRGFDGIEDAFSASDYKNHILANANAQVVGKNSVHAKKNGASKPLLAAQFLVSVNEGKLNMTSFDAITQTNIRQIADLLSETLSSLPQHIAADANETPKRSS